jgi:hypothetical protein
VIETLFLRKYNCLKENFYFTYLFVEAGLNSTPPASLESGNLLFPIIYGEWLMPTTPFQKRIIFISFKLIILI